MDAHADELLHPFGIQFGHQVPGGIPVAGGTQGITGRLGKLGLFTAHRWFLGGKVLSRL
ncbi:hypothetical protein D3C72_2441670 [compost metagenome]